MNIKTATVAQLQERLVEVSKEYEKYKTKLISSYKKMDELAIEYQNINKILEEKQNGR